MVPAMDMLMGACVSVIRGTEVSQALAHHDFLISVLSAVAETVTHTEQRLTFAVLREMTLRYPR